MTFLGRIPWRPGPSSLAASGTGAWRAPTLSSAPGPGSRLSAPQTLIVVLFCARIQVLAALPTTTEPDTVHQQLAALVGLNASPSKNCPPGSYLSEYSGDCTTCTDKEDFTSYANTLSACQPCSKCYPDKEEVEPCTRTKDTQCQCKPGTYQDKDSPEFCQKCSPGCPDGKVEDTPCNPWSDRKCVDQESGSTQMTNIRVGVGVGVGVVLLLLATVYTYYYRRRICQGCGMYLNRVCFWKRVTNGPGAQDNARNMIISDTDLPSTLASEQELEYEEHTEPAGVLVQPPGEAKPLLGSAGADRSPVRRGRLVPAIDGDPVESLRLFFDYFSKVVPFNSWNPLMRSLGLTDNEICVARARVSSDPQEALYEMLVTWIKNAGRAASVNTLLDALETLGERNAKEMIQDHLVESGKYVYEANEASSAVPRVKRNS